MWISQWEPIHEALVGRVLFSDSLCRVFGLGSMGPSFSLRSRLLVLFILCFCLVFLGGRKWCLFLA